MGAFYKSVEPRNRRCRWREELKDAKVSRLVVSSRSWIRSVSTVRQSLWMHKESEPKIVIEPLSLVSVFSVQSFRFYPLQIEASKSDTKLYIEIVWEDLTDFTELQKKLIRTLISHSVTVVATEEFVPQYMVCDLKSCALPGPRSKFLVPVETNYKIQWQSTWDTSGVPTTNMKYFIQRSTD